MKTYTSKLLLLAVFLLAGAGLQAQTVANKIDVPVKAQLSQVGYPSKIVPGNTGSFIYKEFWNKDMDHKTANEYLQGYGLDKFDEQWSLPITKEGAKRMKVLDMFRTENRVVLVGQQYGGKKGKEIVTTSKFFTFDGRDAGAPKQLSCYDKKAKKGYSDVLALSTDGSKLVWMGHNPEAKYKKRRNYFTVFHGDGRLLWKKRLIVPHVNDDKYLVKQVTVDGKGNLYLLLNYEELTNSAKDTLNLPILMRYDYRENKFTEHKLEFPGASVTEAQMYVTEEGELVFMGVLSDGSASGFMNLTKHAGSALRWNKLIYKKFKIERDLSVVQDFTMEIPEAWVSKYGQRGANFFDSRLMEHEGMLYWILEEQYTQIHNSQKQFLFYDVAIVKMDLEEGQIQWATSFDKKQRDYVSGEMLGFVPGISRGKLHFVYLNERGAQGKVVCTSVDLNSAEVSQKNLLKNDDARALFFPARSSMINDNTMMLMGVGHPNEQNYSLIKIQF